MSETTGEGGEPKAGYEIRPFEPGDADGFLSLYETVMGKPRGKDWFDWKYASNPYVDRVPITVAVSEGSIVGTRPFFALPVRVDGEREVALQPCDTMVHPDHRRRGLFTRMTERAIERYDDDHPFFFNFPNHRSLPGYRKLGWRVVSKRPGYYRIAEPGTVAAARTDRAAVSLASRVATPLAKGYYGLRDRRTTVPSEVSVRASTEPPARELAALYRRSVPEGIHAVRDEAFYEWRFGNPDWKYTTYVAEGDTGPEAAIITGTSVGSSPTATKLTDVVPLGSAPKPHLSGLIDRILADRSETDLFVAPAQGIPDAVLRGFGFHPDTVPPLSLFANQTTHAVRALDRDWERDGTEIDHPDDWLLTFVEGDTS